MVKAIYLTGFMGAGKTTIGEELAKQLQLPVIDTDQQIERTLNKSIREIFEQHGEQYFRNQETCILKELPTTDTIITTGGGIVINSENREWMKKNGQVVLLNADLDTIYERVHKDPNRPIASKKNKAELIDLYQSRVEFYKDCTFIVETAHKNIDEIVNEISERLK
ncbi:shikimate kinase [Metabacillus crassostreae]|uniref:shikimate kinase n=1 Tax=Metabacillus crassostreae TaxID=929098 RepID=UPI001EF902B1|nr:shikimate kinase [Metabacillus crassostreae]MBM7604670.1 shikimate kinase [Metabacillus crassostreae]